MVVIAVVTNPLMRTEASIRRHLLNIMPVGTSFDDVIDIVESNDNWTIRGRSGSSGVVLHPTLSIPMSGMPTDRFPVVGEQHIQIHLGMHNFVLRSDVTAYIAFDENGKLIEIFVRRDRDVI